MDGHIFCKFAMALLVFPAVLSAQDAKKEIPAIGFDGKTLILPMPGATVKEALKSNDLKSLSIDAYIQPVDFNKYITKPRVFPSNPSQTMKRAMLRHMATNPDAGAKNIQMIDRAYANVAKQMDKWLKSAGFGTPVTPDGPMIRVAVFSGVLDPVELVRNYKREKQQERTLAIIAELNRLPEKSETLALKSGFLKNEAELSTDKILQTFVPVQLKDSLSSIHSDSLFLVKKDSLHTDTLRVEQIK